MQLKSEAFQSILKPPNCHGTGTTPKPAAKAAAKEDHAPAALAAPGAPRDRRVCARVGEAGVTAVDDRVVVGPYMAKKKHGGGGARRRSETEREMDF
ncbi:hypothetical protein ON010_g15351 [Phytophthora cinnamomi]|nr:hypothetical protein ON010_g15351 [Phytophthora cinnamomi]